MKGATHAKLGSDILCDRDYRRHIGSFRRGRDRDQYCLHSFRRILDRGHRELCDRPTPPCLLAVDISSRRAKGKAAPPAPMAFDEKVLRVVSLGLNGSFNGCIEVFRQGSLGNKRDGTRLHDGFYPIGTFVDR